MPDTHTHEYRLKGLDCADCAMKLEHRLRALPGVTDAVVNFAAAKLTVTHGVEEEDILRAVRGAGYEIITQSTPDEAHACACAECGIQQPHFWRTHWRVVTTALSGALIVIAWLLDHQAPLALPTIVLYLLAMGIGGYWTFRRGINALRTLTFDMNALMTIAVSGALLIQQWEEAGVVAFLYSLSNLLESYTMEKTRQSIRGLMELAPAEATVLRDGSELRVSIAEVQPGDVVVVMPAAKIPVDGTVIAGASAVNQAPITGEAMPVEKRPGDPVYAGTLNTLGALEVRVTRSANDTMLAHIIHQVEEAQARRAPAQAFIERFARWYTPTALGFAIIIAVMPPLALPLFGIAAPWAEWFYRALALLVVACPCALVISTPVAIVTAIGTAARHGVLIKGGAHLEQAGRIAVIAFDKTGTLTRGRPDVTDVVPLDGMASHDLLGVAAAVERRATHPLADAILRAATRDGVAIPPAEDFRALPGLGATAVIDGVSAYVGSPALFAELGTATSEAEPHLRVLRDGGKTAMLIGTEERIFGIIAAADGVRAESADAIRGLRRAGIRQVAMLTGDHADIARALAARLGVDEVKADLLPEQKTTAIEALRAEHGTVAMVGDGINDAPALATADLGIAMGVAGTDTALETADIALMADNLSRVPFTMRLSRKTLGIIKQNIALALGLKALALALVFPGWLTIWLAVLADMGATILVTLNALRLLQERPRDRES